MRTQIANNIMFYIYRHIDISITLDELSTLFGVSKFHMIRLFQEEFGKSIHETIQSIRLQKAASLLLSNPHSTITSLAALCGYSSQSAFIRVFKDHFSMTPKAWRHGGYEHFAHAILSSSHSASVSAATFDHLTPTIEYRPTLRAYYIRHKGYNPSIRQTWQKLVAWMYDHPLETSTMIGIHHDNPTITPLHECQYVACIETPDIITTSLPMCLIPEGVYARFDFEGVYGDILKFMQWVYFQWLITSGYETTTNPSYAIYHKNHFLSPDGHFCVSYYIPVKYGG